MSYDVSIAVPTGPDATSCVFDGNYTSNCSPMWTHALGTSLRDFAGAPCSEAAGPLAAGVRRMEADPDLYREWNPENGWGDYDSALAFLRSIADAAKTHSYGTISVHS